MQHKQITLRCKDGQEAVVFTKYIYDFKDASYEINFEDSYTGGYYKGFFGRLKRAYKAFIGAPVIYTGIYCDDESEIQKFLIDCFKLTSEESEKN